MTTVKQVLGQKSKDLWSIGPDATVFDAIAKMADKDVGSILVMDDGKLVGIITERHYARRIALKGKTSPSVLVRDIMERQVMYVRPDQSLEECLALMTAKHVRHLPVLDGEKVIGIVSIGDLGKGIIADQKFVIEQLVHYVHG